MLVGFELNYSIIFGHVMSLNGKKVLVVGGGTSIGQEVVENFLICGASVLVTVNKNRPSFLNHQDITVGELDLSNKTSLMLFCAEVVPEFGVVDVVVFLSGILPGRNLASYDYELMHQVMTVNFTGQAALLNRLLPHLAEQGLVLMVSSISAERGSFDPIYAASKAAQLGFVKSLAVWLAPKIRVNAIAPALIKDSTMFHDMQPKRRTYHKDHTPTGRLTTKEEIAGVILNLCEPAWSNVNGQVIRINGGEYV